jgi:hypothetical protein
MAIAAVAKSQSIRSQKRGAEQAGKLPGPPGKAKSILIPSGDTRTARAWQESLAVAADLSGNSSSDEAWRVTPGRHASVFQRTASAWQAARPTSA